MWKIWFFRDDSLIFCVKRLASKIADIVFQGSVSSAKFHSIIQTAINGRRATFELRGVCTSLVKPSSTKSCHTPKLIKCSGAQKTHLKQRIRTFSVPLLCISQMCNTEFKRQKEELQAENQSLWQENTNFCSAHEELQWKKSGLGVIRLGNGSVLIGSNADTHILTEEEYMDCYLKANDPKELHVVLKLNLKKSRHTVIQRRWGSLWQRKVC